MDYSSNYWAIEEVQFEKPQIQPLILFDKYSEREKFNDYDFEQFIQGCLYFRRDILWIRSGKYGIYTDMTWPFYHCTAEIEHECMHKSLFEHASQPLVTFWMNHNFVPREYWRILVDEENWNRGNEETFHELCTKGNRGTTL